MTFGIQSRQPLAAAAVSANYNLISQSLLPLSWKRKKSVMTRINPVTINSLKEAHDLKNSVDGIGNNNWCVLIRFNVV